MQHRMTSATRRLILAAAFAAGLAGWLVPQSASVSAATDAAPLLHTAQAVVADKPTAPAKDTPKAGADDAQKAPPGPQGAPKAQSADAPKSKAADAADDEDSDADAKSEASDITIDHHGIRLEKGKKRIRIGAFGSDREYASFQDFVQDAPWLAGLVFLTVVLVFLVPLLIIILLIWYKVRKNRMLNETMIQLAEKGVVPPAEAMEALGSNSRIGAGSSPAPAPPLYEQAQQIRRRAAWTDLRKGVLMLAVGAGLSAYSLFDDASPNGVGLILLFVGIGYCVLWFFEDRDPARTAPTPARGNPPPGGA